MALVDTSALETEKELLKRLYGLTAMVLDFQSNHVGKLPDDDSGSKLAYYELGSLFRASLGSLQSDILGRQYYHRDGATAANLEVITRFFSDQLDLIEVSIGQARIEILKILNPT